MRKTRPLAGGESPRSLRRSKCTPDVEVGHDVRGHSFHSPLDDRNRIVTQLNNNHGASCSFTVREKAAVPSAFVHVSSLPTCFSYTHWALSNQARAVWRCCPCPEHLSTAATCLGARERDASPELSMLPLRVFLSSSESPFVNASLALTQGRDVMPGLTCDVYILRS